MSIQNGGHLLTYASSLLDPDVFSHPVWRLFGGNEGNPNNKDVNDLLEAANALLSDDPSGACQVLFICAVYQSKMGVHEDAIKTIQLAFATAQKNDLPREMIWAKWGTSAICIQQGNHKKAAGHLNDLQKELIKQDEWILADFVEVINQSLDQSDITVTGKALGPPTDNLLATTMDWLHNWGVPLNGVELNFGVISDQKTHNLRLKQLFPVITSWKKKCFELFRRVLRITIPRGIKKNVGSPSEIVSVAGTPQKDLKSSENGRINEKKGKIDIPAPPNPSDKFSNSNDSQSINPSRKRKTSSKNKKGASKKSKEIDVFVQMLGSFNLIFQDSPLQISNSRGLSLLKYLLLHHDRVTPRELLMDIFWPEANPESARNNLNVAMYSLRQALRSKTDQKLVYFENGVYGLAPNIKLWLDVEEFENCIKEGIRHETREQLTPAVAEYEIAVNLYRGDFLAENLYEGWTVLERERLRVNYLDTLDHLSQIYFSQERYASCVTLCQQILSRDLCREDAYCRLMRCYSRLGQGPLALRQYQICVQALQSELEVDPAQETTMLYEQIRHHDRV